MSFRVVATPYGARALDALREVVGELKAGDPMAAVTLVVPNNLAAIVARRHLASGLSRSGKGFAGASLTTLPRLAERVGSPSLHPRRPATASVVSAAWRAALDSGPSIFDPVKDHPATVRALVSAHRELRDLSDSALDGVAGASALARDLVRLHRVATSSLATGWYDQTDLLDAAAAALASGSAPLELGRPVLYLPQRLSLAETRFARSLAEGEDVVVIVGLTDVRRADRVVLQGLDRIGAGFDQVRSKPRTAHEVLHASDSDDEARCVVREVVACLELTPAHRIAILYGSAQPYARLLHEHLAAAGITDNGAGTRPVIERAMGRGFLDILRLAAGDVPRAEFFTAVSEAPTRTFDGSRVPASRWERMSRSAAVVGGDDWELRLDAHARSIEADLVAEEGRDDPYKSRIDGYRRDLETVEGLRDFATTLRARLQEGRGLTGWPELSAWAMRLFTDLYGDAQALARLPPEEQYAATTVESVLRGLPALAAFEPAADLQSLVDVLTLEVESALPRIGRFGDGVLVAPVSAAVGLDVDVLYVVGLAEDTFPGRLGEDALLLERVRDLSQGELASYRDRLDARQRHLLAAFDAAPRVVASFPRGDLRRSTGRRPSHWLVPTLRELSGNPTLAATDWETAVSDRIRSSPSYAKSLTSQRLPASEQEWRTQAAWAGRPLHDDRVDRALALIRGRASDVFTRFDGNLAGAEGLPDYTDPRRVLSPTALESYATCPHAFFAKRLLRVEPVEQPEEIIQISALDIGSLIHQTMDAFVTEFAGSLPGYGDPWTAGQRARLHEIALEQAGLFEGRGSTGHARLWEAERDRILADLSSMLDDDEARRARESARVVQSELAFGFGEDDFVEVAAPQGAVRFRGSADLVEERRDGTLVVIDIKTGGAKRFALIKKDPIAAGTKLQLPIYAQAARQLLHAGRAEAAYWFVRQGKHDWIPVELTDELDVTFRVAVGTLVASIAGGLFPAKAPEEPDFAWVQCGYCNPDGLGHVEVRRRWERKRLDPQLRNLVTLIDADALRVAATVAEAES